MTPVKLIGVGNDQVKAYSKKNHIYNLVSYISILNNFKRKSHMVIVIIQEKEICVSTTSTIVAYLLFASPRTLLFLTTLTLVFPSHCNNVYQECGLLKESCHAREKIIELGTQHNGSTDRHYLIISNHCF